MSVVYRERERERERDRYDDSRSNLSSSQRGGNYTTVKRYRVTDDDAHSTTFDGRRYGARDPPAARVEETRIVRREREEPEPRPERVEANYTRRERVERVPDSRWEDDIVIRRTKEVDEPPRREYRAPPAPETVTDRELVIRRTAEKDGFERDKSFQVERYEDRRKDFRDYEVISPSREDFGDLQKYSRTAEYYAQPNPPQTIVIRNEPIIIRERIRDDDYALIHRSEVEERQISRREPSPPKKEEFYYEKKIVERDPRSVEREEDFYSRREVSPGDSISQVGVGVRRRSRSRGRSRYSDSDESMVYVRKEVKETKETSRSESPNHRRHVAEGALAGFGAAELLRHHKKSQGKETSGPIARLGKDVGAGVLGAVGATAISRARSRHRSKSRRRERSESSERDGRRSRRRHSRSRSKSRSQSHSRLKTLGGLALAAAAAGTAVAVAKRRNKNEPEDRRSRSRHRRHSASEATDDARNPAHRNKRIAEAGAAGAVVAGLIERARSKSRKREGNERSRSRIRTGLPIAAAGLGSAAIAGIYERNKANKQDEAAVAAERRKSRSRSRSHARSAYGEAPRGSVSDPNLIEYGNGPMYGNIPQADYYGRPAAHDPYYNAAMVPAAAGAAYGAHREARRSHSRDRRPSSSEGSDDRRRRRHHRHHRSQSRDIATPALAAIGGGIAAAEYAKRKEKKKAEKARRRYEEEHGHGHGHGQGQGQDPYEDEYDPVPRRYTPTPPSSADPYGNPNQYYRPDDQLPPPPGSAPPPLYPPQQPLAGYQQQGPYPAQPTYNPAAYAQQPGAPPPINPAYPPPQNSASSAGFPPGTPFASGGNGDPRLPRGRGDENVSAPPNGNFFPGEPRHAFPDGVNQARVPSPPLQNSSMPRSSSQPPPAPKNVAFDLGSDGSQLSSPDRRRHKRRGETNRGYEAEDDSESTADGRDKRYPTHHPISETESDPEKSARHRKSHRRRHHHHPDDDHHHNHVRPRRSSRNYGDAPSATRPDRPPSPTGSDTTIVLPDRFDKEGRPKPQRGDDAVADIFEDLFSGKGPGGKYFKKIFGGSENDAGPSRRR